MSSLQNLAARVAIRAAVTGILCALLAKEFLKPLRMSNHRLAKEIGVPAQRIGEILAGKRAITADTDLRLCRFFRLSDGWWLRLQADCDIEVA